MVDPLQPGRAYPNAAGAFVRGESLTAAIVIYALYIVALFTGGLSMILGVILAYVFKGAAGPVARSHYVFQIRTFWGGIVLIALGVLLIAIGVPLMLVLIGFPIMIVGGFLAGAAHLWQIVRCAVGLWHAGNGRAYPEPLTPLI